MPEISIIVPVYKVEEYLSDCIRSILQQTFEDYELILIDDGSPDQSGRICDEFASQDQRIKVIHQNNQGLSGARNTGMDAAAGNYITFVDSDDLIMSDYLAQLYSALKAEHADVSVCRMREFVHLDSKSTASCSADPANKRCYTNVEACIELYNGSRNIPVNAWGKLFSAEIIAAYRFPVGKLHEDQAVIPLICYRAGRVVSIDKELYCYRIRDNSITKKSFSIKRYDDIWAIDQCIAFFEEHREETILSAARNKRRRLLCVYSIYARRDKVKVPKEYTVGVIEAVLYLRKHVAPQKYQYYLAQISPALARLSEYGKKASSIIGRTV